MGKYLEFPELKPGVHLWIIRHPYQSPMVSGPYIVKDRVGRALTITMEDDDKHFVEIAKRGITFVDEASAIEKCWEYIERAETKLERRRVELKDRQASYKVRRACG